MSSATTEPKSPAPTGAGPHPSAAHHVPWLSYLSLAASTSVIGSYVGLSKLLVVVFPVFLLAFLRFGMAAVFMLPWLKRGPTEKPLTGRTRFLLFLESFFGNFLFSICLLFGMKHSSAVVAGVIMAGIPATVALMSWLFLRERIAPRTLFGIAMAVGGIVMVALDRHGGGEHLGDTSAWGALLLVGAMCCEASYVVIGKRLTADLPPRRISALINLWGLVLVTPLGLWQAMDFDFGAVAVKDWGLLLFYAIAASTVTVWLWMKGLQHVSAAKAGVFMVFLPIATALVGLLLLGEQMSGIQLFAYALALGGVVLATWPGRASS